MPNLEEHCEHTLKRYGIRGEDIHTFLDDPSRKYGGGHRQFRHDMETIKLVGEIFGKKYGKSLAENIALDHIMLDHREEVKRHSMIIVQLPEKKDIPSIPCPYCSTLLKPTDQKCPNCGATRKRIIEEFDRAFELEKMKLQEKRRELRKELKRELKLRKFTPEQRLEKRRRSPFLKDPILDKIIEEDKVKHPEVYKRFQEKQKRIGEMYTILFVFITALFTLGGFLIGQGYDLYIIIGWTVTGFILGIILSFMIIFMLSI